MRILLVQPSPFEDRRLGLENSIWLSEPVALLSVAAMVPEHEVKILDMRLEKPQALPNEIRVFQPDIIGTTAMTTDAYQAKAVLRLARELAPKALTIIGGHHCTMLPSFYDKPYVDVIVKGEGEIIFRDLVDRWQAMLSEGKKHDLSVLEGVEGVELYQKDKPRACTPKPADADLDVAKAASMAADAAVAAAPVMNSEPRSEVQTQNPWIFTT